MATTPTTVSDVAQQRLKVDSVMAELLEIEAMTRQIKLQIKENKEAEKAVKKLPNEKVWVVFGDMFMKVSKPRALMVVSEVDDRFTETLQSLDEQKAQLAMLWEAQKQGSAL